MAPIILTLFIDTPMFAMVSEASVSVLQGIFQLDTKSTEFYCPFFLIARPETTFALHNLSCCSAGLTTLD